MIFFICSVGVTVNLKQSTLVLLQQNIEKNSNNGFFIVLFYKK